MQAKNIHITLCLNCPVTKKKSQSQMFGKIDVFIARSNVNPLQSTLTSRDTKQNVWGGGGINKIRK